MYSFEELSYQKTTKSFAYWLLVEKREQNKEEYDLSALSSFMSYHYGQEEQVYDEGILEDSFFESFHPVAPVTLTERWSSFALCNELLGNPITKARETDGQYCSAFGVWNSGYLGEMDPMNLSEHPRHCVFLLRLACALAEEHSKRILLVGTPGWSYSHWRNKEFMMNPDTSLLLHQAGYLYTDRIAQ